MKQNTISVNIVLDIPFQSTFNKQPIQLIQVMKMITSFVLISNQKKSNKLNKSGKLNNKSAQQGKVVK